MPRRFAGTPGRSSRSDLRRSPRQAATAARRTRGRRRQTAARRPRAPGQDAGPIEDREPAQPGDRKRRSPPRCAGISGTSPRATDRPLARCRARPSRRARGDRHFCSGGFFEITELRVRSSSDLTKRCSAHIICSFVMLIATWNQASAPHASALRASACSGRAWSSSDRRCAGYRSSVMPGTPGMPVRRIEASRQEDSTRKQVIPHTAGAPDS
jgi:hypothetical protein